MHHAREMMDVDPTRVNRIFEHEARRFPAGLIVDSGKSIIFVNAQHNERFPPRDASEEETFRGDRCTFAK
jgi:hypothetical protein